MSDTLCDQLTGVEAKDDSLDKQLDINGFAVYVSINKI